MLTVDLAESERKRKHGHYRYLSILVEIQAKWRVGWGALHPWDEQAMVKKILRILKEVDKVWCLPLALI